MEIKFEGVQRSKISLEQITPGTVFVYDGKVMLKTNRVYGAVSKREVFVLVVELQDGAEKWMKSYKEVSIPNEAYLVIKEEC